MRSYLVCYLLAIIGFTISCKNTLPDHGGLVDVLKNASHLASAEFDLEKIVIADQSKKLLFLIPLQEVSFMAKTEASLKTGIDFEKIQAKDIKIEGTSIRLTLPPIEVVDFSYPADRVHPIAKYTHLRAFGNQLKNSEIDEILQQAQLQLMENINHLNLRAVSERKVTSTVTNLLRLEGFEQITIEFTPSDQPLMYSAKPSKSSGESDDKLLDKLKSKLP